MIQAFQPVVNRIFCRAGQFPTGRHQRVKTGNGDPLAKHPVWLGKCGSKGGVPLLKLQKFDHAIKNGRSHLVLAEQRQLLH